MHVVEKQQKFILTPNQYSSLKINLNTPPKGYALLFVPPDIGKIKQAVYRFFDTPDLELWNNKKLEFRILEAGRYLWFDIKMPLGDGNRQKIRINVADRYQCADDFMIEDGPDIIETDQGLDKNIKSLAKGFLKNKKFVEVLRFAKTTDRLHFGRVNSPDITCKAYLDLVDFRQPGIKDDDLLLYKMDLQTEGETPDFESLEEIAKYYEIAYNIAREPIGGLSTFEIGLALKKNWK